MIQRAPAFEARPKRSAGESRVLIVQYAGDHLAAYERMQRKQGETYLGHAYSLEQATGLGAQYGDAAFLCCRSPRRYVTRTPEGLTLIGAAADPRRDSAIVLEFARQYNPSHLVVMGPLTSVLRWGVQTGRRTIGVFASSFETTRIRHLVRYGRLTSVLNSSPVEWIANHGLNACYSLKRIGVTPEKIIPWDWPHTRKPSDLPPKAGWDGGRLSALYVGLLVKAKGVGDAIRALYYLRNSGLPFRLQIAGEGNVEEFRRLTHRLGITEHVDFLGLVSNDRVFDLMRQATCVIVPTRHEYPETGPLTMYEALCSRTPIIASDHPIFHGRLRERENALIFPAGKARVLASKIEELVSDPVLYATLSRESEATWQGLQVPVKWGDLLHHWVRGKAEDVEWLKGQSLARRFEVSNI